MPPEKIEIRRVFFFRAQKMREHDTLSDNYPYKISSTRKYSTSHFAGYYYRSGKFSKTEGMY